MSCVHSLAARVAFACCPCAPYFSISPSTASQMAAVSAVPPQNPPPSGARHVAAGGGAAPSALAVGMSKAAFSEVVRASIDLKSRASVEIMARNDPSIRASQQRIRDLATGAAKAPGKVEAIPEQTEQRAKERVNINATVKAADVVVHTYTHAEMTDMLKTDLARGLTAEEGRAKLARDGQNVLTPPPETPWYVKLAMQMVGGFQVMMIFGAILCFIVGPISVPVDYQTIYLGVVLVIVVISTGFFAWWQERKSDSVRKTRFGVSGGGYSVISKLILTEKRGVDHFDWTFFTVMQLVACQITMERKYHWLLY